MIKRYKELLKDVYLLAEKRHIEYRNSHKKNSNGSDFLDLSDIEEQKDNSGLLEFLLSQNMEAIKVIQTVMYIGRDYEVETEEENYERMEHNHEWPDDIIPEPNLKSENPEKLLNEWLSHSDGVSEWENKCAEVEQIYHKLPLDEYLKRAFIILGIY